MRAVAPPLAVVAVLASALAFAASASGGHATGAASSAARKTATLTAREHRQERTIRSSRSTLVFFERHAALLYAGRGVRRDGVGRRAWREVAFAKARIGWTKRELGETRAALERLRQPAIPHKSQWNCIHGYEGSWTDPNSPYYGGLQMDLEFMYAHGLDFLLAKGTADHWTPAEQMVVAERAFAGIRTDQRSNGRVYLWHDKPRGFAPWPNTARYCGLLP